MISEIYGKISRDGSNLSDQMEDKLTGDFFGAIRYLPYEKGLKIVLENIKYLEEKNKKILSNKSNGFIGSCINFWPRYNKTELDLSIELDNLLIGVEVKYNSGLSSEDQLEREINVLRDLRKDRNCVLLFIARSSGISEAIQSIEKIKIQDSKKMKYVEFAYISWEEIYEVMLKYYFNNSSKYSSYEKIIMEDLLDLLKRKEFIRFKNFKIDTDYNINKNKYFTIDLKLDKSWNFNYGINVEEKYYVFR